MNFKRYDEMSPTDGAEAFRVDAIKELQLQDNSEINHIFQKAWRYGYLGGYEEVFEHFKDLVGILRENDQKF